MNRKNWTSFPKANILYSFQGKYHRGCRMKNAWVWLTTILFCICTGFAGMAEDSAMSTEPPKGYEVFDLGEVYVTADRLPAVKEMTITTEISAEEIAATNSKTVAEALRFVPGVRISTGRKNEPNIQIHGFDQSRTLVLIDGVPYYETNFGRLDLSQIPIDNVAKIEVTKGVSSVLYGPNALGGVINIVTRKPSEKPSLEAILEAGENNTSKISFSHGMKSGIFNYWLNYAHQESGGFSLSDDYEARPGTIIRKPGSTTEEFIEDGGLRNNSDYRSDSFWAKAGIEPDNASEYYLNFHYITREKGYPTSTDEVQVFTSRPAFAHFARITRYDDWGADLSGQKKFSDAVTIKAKLFYHNHLDDLTSFADKRFSRKIAVSRYKDYLAGGSLMADVLPYDWYIMRVSFIYRGDSHKERDDSYLPFAESFSYTGSFALENEFSMTKNASIVAGLGYDWFRVTEAERNITDKSTGDLLRQDKLHKPDTMDELSPMIGVRYQMRDSTRLFASIARKVRFPTLQQLFSSKSGNADLSAEKSTTYTVGISQAFSDIAACQLSLFYYDISDFISRDAPGPLGGQYQNFADIDIYGVELSGDIYPFSDLVIHAGYTYDKARDRSDDRVTDNVVNIPEHKFDLGIKYTIPYILTSIDLTSSYVSDVFSQLPTSQRPTQEAIRAGDYFIVNARISRTFFRNYEAYLALNNLFDSDYESEAGFPAPGRNFHVGVTAKF